MTTIPATTFGALGAALIASLVSFLTLIITKENKISEFRQLWIDGLRADIAKYHALANMLSATVRLEGREVDVWKSAKESVTSLNEADALIRLRLNSDEANSKPLLDCLAQVEREFLARPDLNYEGIDKALMTFLTAAQKLLRTEWKRVKSGEMSYRIAKVLFIAMMICLVLVWSAFGFFGPFS